MAAFQTLMRPYRPPVARRCPSGLQAKQKTFARCPYSVRIRRLSGNVRYRECQRRRLRLPAERVAGIGGGVAGLPTFH